MKDKTHYRKAFTSPYLASSDLDGVLNLTIKRVILEDDKSKRTKDSFNTAYFAEEFIRPGEKLKPMILNVTNCDVLKKMSGSSYIDDWCGLLITVFVDCNVKMKKETVGGLRIMPQAISKPFLTPAHTAKWEHAKAAFKRDGNLFKVFEKVTMTQEHQEQLMKECEDSGVDLKCVTPVKQSEYEVPSDV